MAELRVRYDNPDTVAENIEWLVDTDTIELRELALPKRQIGALLADPVLEPFSVYYHASW